MNGISIVSVISGIPVCYKCLYVSEWSIMIVKLNTIFHLLLPLDSFKSQFSNFTGQYAFTLQLNGDFPEQFLWIIRYEKM
jgi:hypothetical protein